MLFLTYSTVCYYFVFFFFKQKTAYEMRISDWSSDVCSSDLGRGDLQHLQDHRLVGSEHRPRRDPEQQRVADLPRRPSDSNPNRILERCHEPNLATLRTSSENESRGPSRSEEHTSELQSLMSTSYAALCLNKNNKNKSP